MISTNRFTFSLAVLHFFLLACDCVHSQILQGRSWIARLTNKQDSSVVNNSLPNRKSSAFASAAAAEQNDSEDDSNVDQLEDGDLIIPEADAYTQEHHPCEIGFEGIRMVLKQKKKNEDRVILDGSIKGFAKPGRMLAIMGPSGSGKTTFLHALAGKIKQNSRIQLSGMRFLNGNTVPGDAFIPAAFIEQETNFFPYMTVKETLDFRVELKLGRTVDQKARDDIVKELMSLLSLSKSANTIVGNNKIRGVSGGERKRLSIACEMIDSPPVIFLDEPTSGLDSYQSLQVVQTMRRLANSGKTVVAVIHQPSQRIFSLFDDLLLLSEGKQMYFGEVKNVRSYFDGIGFSCANEEGTAEHILDIVSLATSSTNGHEEKILHDHLDTISAYAMKQTQNLDVRLAKGYSGLDVSSKEVKTLLKRARLHNTPSSNIFRQFKLLFHRSFKEILRGKSVILLKAVQQITLGLIYGGIYSLGRDQSSIMDRFGLLNLIVVGTANMALATTIRSFPKEKSIVVSEIGAHLYRTFPYLLSKAMSEIPLTALLSSLLGVIIYPLAGLQKVKSKFLNFLGLSTLHSIACQATGLFLGAISPSSDFALALLPPIVVLSIIFDGRNISIENIPKLLRFLPKVGVVRWGYEGLATNEFLGLEFTAFGSKRGPILKTGEEALERFGLGRSTLPQIARAELCIIAGSWLLSYLGLSLTSDKYVVMEVPTEKA